jgi:2-dehydro-3-deoxygluconokinase
MTAIRAANALGVPVSFDLNFRSKLWTEAEARACFLEIVPMVTILFASRGNIGTFFGINGDHEEVMQATRERFGVSVTILSRKKAKASRSVKLGCMAMGPNGDVVNGEWRSVEVVDRLGGGDAFAGGFLAGYVRDRDDLARAVALGGAAQALKHTMPGDLLTATAAEIEANVLSSDGGVLQR